MINLVPFSKKQRQILSWWHPVSPVKDADGIICDGSIRAGKTLPMSISFIEWAFHNFNDQAFGMAGKSVGSFKRNVLFWLKPILYLRGYSVQHKQTENVLTLSKRGKSNHFYIFGGRDESSQDLVQGVTLAGFLFDEVALMPESFVNQATGRCSVEGAKLWFNCNPESPSHWFKLNWLDKHKEKKLLHLHFTMEDNPSLSTKTKESFYSRYFGVFFKRYILGLWVVADGSIYDMWTEDNVYDECPVVQGTWDASPHDIAVDYGTVNPMVFLDIIDTGELILVDREYYHNSRKEETLGQKTDSQYADDFDVFTGGPENIRWVIIDPSAASFRAELRHRGYRVKEADNTVLDGIRLTASLIGKRIVKVNARCTNLIREVGSYVWDTKRSDKGVEQPIKANDHCMDSLRYYVKTLFNPRRLMDN